MSDIRSVLYDDAVAVTPSDTTDDPAGPFAGFYVGATGGNVKVRTSRGTDITFAGTIVGTVYHISIKRVWSTGTGAGSILGLRAANDVR